MIALLGIGFLAGLIAGVSPCILPVLPVAFVSWTAPVKEGQDPVVQRRRRAVAVVAGLVLSFSAITLVGSTVLSSFGISKVWLMRTGLVMIGLLAVGLLVPQFERILEKPFARLARHTPSGRTSGFLLGLGLGAVFVPCAGPVLTAIVLVGAHNRVGFWSVLLTLSFAIGATLPLLALALAGDRLIERNRALRTRAKQLRPLGGALLLFMALAIGFNWLSGLQTWLPGYTTSLTKAVEGNSYTKQQLRELAGQKVSGALSDCHDADPALQSCGAAPEFVGISAWLNTPGNQPLHVAQLHGHVVLVDFWTYSCINCLRSLPHVESWYQRYHAFGLDVVGVHSPEFAFEHVVSNVTAAAQSLGVKYPVAVDNDLATWNNYVNQYWPAQYLIDANGEVRHVDFGEGNYPLSETLIRQLLHLANPTLSLPPPTNVPDRTPTAAISPETYLGTDRAQYYVGANPVNGVTINYPYSGSLPPGYYQLGGLWRVDSQFATAEGNAQLRINFLASHVYLVLGGTGTVRVRVGSDTHAMAVSGFPRLYTLVARPSSFAAVLNLSFTKGVRAYSFTFG